MNLNPEETKLVNKALSVALGNEGRFPLPMREAMRALQAKIEKGPVLEEDEEYDDGEDDLPDDDDDGEETEGEDGEETEGEDGEDVTVVDNPNASQAV